VKYLVAGLGNIGAEYQHTRHNIGFDVADKLAASLGAVFASGKKSWVAEAKFRGRSLVIIKPTTYMNLSGEAVRYWKNELKLENESLLIVADELALPFGTLRLRPAGGPAGHNGLTSIIECLGTDKFPRLRFGIGADYPKGRQSDFVLGHWSSTESAVLAEKISLAEEIVKSFIMQGIQTTMNQYNNR
jgi:peptidyl-tRNA hydrolase, PTH1 family